MYVCICMYIYEPVSIDEGHDSVCPNSSYDKTYLLFTWWVKTRWHMKKKEKEESWFEQDKEGLVRIGFNQEQGGWA